MQIVTPESFKAAHRLTRAPDAMGCDECEASICDCGDYWQCEACEHRLCVGCQKRMNLEQYYEDEDDEDSEKPYCPFCASDLATDSELLEFAIKRLKTPQ